MSRCTVVCLLHTHVPMPLHSGTDDNQLVYFIAQIKAKNSDDIAVIKYHFLKNFHQITMPRIASSIRMMTANMILFWNTLHIQTEIHSIKVSP